MDVNRDRVRPMLVIEPIKLFLKNGLRNDATQPSHQVFQDRALASRQDQRGAAYPHVSLHRVEADVAGLQRHSERTAGTPQQGLGARDQLGHRKRLHEIVVGTGIEAADAILDRVARGQHQDRRPIAARPQFAKQFEAVAVRQSEIDDRRVVGGHRERRPRVAAEAHDIHGESCARQARFDELGDPRFVFDNQQAHERNRLLSQLGRCNSNSCGSAASFTKLPDAPKTALNKAP